MLFIASQNMMETCFSFSLPEQFNSFSMRVFSCIFRFLEGSQEMQGLNVGQGEPSINWWSQNGVKP